MNNRPFTTEEQQDIITLLASSVKDKYYSSAVSRQLAKDLQNRTLTTKERFICLQTYMSNNENTVRELAKTINTLIMFNITREAIEDNDLDAAYRNYKVFHRRHPAVIANIISKSITIGTYQEEYATHWDMSKLAYRNNFIRFEANKFDHDPTIAFLSLGTTLAAHVVVKTSFSFFSYKGRHFNEASEVMATFNRLNTMHSLPESQKKTILLAIMNDYQSGFCFKRSKQSKKLIADLQTSLNIGDTLYAWEAMVKYVVKNETSWGDSLEENTRNVSSNNGKRLYNIIVKQLEMGNQLEMRNLR